MRVRVDRDKCIGVGNCVEIMPDVFDQDEDDGIVILLQEEVDDSRLDELQQAADVCPVHAILIGDEES